MNTTLNHSIINRMLNLINEYDSEMVSLCQLVKGLESGIQAMDPPLSSDKNRHFFDLWTVIEEAYATSEEDRYRPFIKEALGKIKNFLSELIGDMGDNE
jgi:hypothetical protein